MTAAHLLFAIVTTVYIVVAIGFEERDLKRGLAHAHARYQQRAPILLPFLRVGRSKTQAA